VLFNIYVIVTKLTGICISHFKIFFTPPIIFLVMAYRSGLEHLSLKVANVDSTLDAVARRCVLGKDTNQTVHPLWWPGLKKTCKQNSFCVGVV